MSLVGSWGRMSKGLSLSASLVCCVVVLWPATFVAAAPAASVRATLRVPNRPIAGEVVGVAGRVAGAPGSTIVIEARSLGGWAIIARGPLPKNGSYSLRWRVPTVAGVIHVRVRVYKRGRLLASSSTRRVVVRQGARQITTHPQYASSFALQPLLGQGRLVLIRYLRLSAESREADEAFAAGAATNGANGIDAVAVICGNEQTAPATLESALIAAPVLVDTEPNCISSLNSQFDGIAGTLGGPERLFLPSGRPVASELNAASTVEAFNLDPAHSAPATVAAWMRIPYLTSANGNLVGADDLDVPIMSNIVGSADALPSSDAVVQGFWWGCPTCVASESDYHLNEWAVAHQGKTVEAFTCDQNAVQASDYAYEHGWAFPVIVYSGPLSFGECFQQIQRGQLGDTFYAETNYIENGKSSNSDPSCEFPDLPDEWGGACATGAWQPARADQIAQYQKLTYNEWAAAGGT